MPRPTFTFTARLTLLTLAAALLVTPCSEAGGWGRRCRVPSGSAPVAPEARLASAPIFLYLMMSPAEADYLANYRPPPLTYQAPVIPPEAHCLVFGEAWADVPTLTWPRRTGPAQPLQPDAPPVEPLPAPTPLPRPAHIEVHVPHAEAKVWFDGTPATATVGQTRRHVTPPLAADAVAVCHVQIEWNEQGQTRRESYEVRVGAGQRARVSFTSRPGSAPSLILLAAQ
ncbi:MAG TPA: TIGR03000 domain-containing protein [Gemmatales bacterium]|nr:TIGR03000 domain-containing protein [Gemmatales bacterium]HMP58007.1 TIGR03000 domain-containing protein [Gemmatales bacterium]